MWTPLCSSRPDACNDVIDDLKRSFENLTNRNDTKWHGLGSEMRKRNIPTTCKLR